MLTVCTTALSEKPVGLVMFNTDEHVLTRPVVRMASQGGYAA